MTNVGGYVLAGGESSRMGAEKSALLLDGKPLVQIAVEKLKRVCGNAAVLCGSCPDRAGELAEAVADLRESCGPLCGVEAALTHSKHEWNLILPVDAPLLPTGLLSAWISDFVSTTGVASVLVHGGVAQPLPLLIRTSALPHIKTCLNRKHYTLHEVTEHAAKELGGRLERVPTETYAFDTNVPREEWFANANYRNDLDRLQAILDNLDGEP